MKHFTSRYRPQTKPKVYSKCIYIHNCYLSNTFYNGTENSFSDNATIGKVKGFEFLFEGELARQQGSEFLNQNHFLRYVADRWIAKVEYVQDGFADIEYFEASQRYRQKIGKKLFHPEFHIFNFSQKSIFRPQGPPHPLERLKFNFQ